MNPSLLQVALERGGATVISAFAFHRLPSAVAVSDAGASAPAADREGGSPGAPL